MLIEWLRVAWAPDSDLNTTTTSLVHSYARLLTDRGSISSTRFSRAGWMAGQLAFDGLLSTTHEHEQEKFSRSYLGRSRADLAAEVFAVCPPLIGLCAAAHRLFEQRWRANHSDAFLLRTGCPHRLGVCATTATAAIAALCAAKRAFITGTGLLVRSLARLLCNALNNARARLAHCGRKTRQHNNNLSS